MARDIAKTEEYGLFCKLRKKVEMLFAHLKRILGLGRLRLRGPGGAKDEFLLAATAQNLWKLAKLFPETPKGDFDLTRTRSPFLHSRAGQLSRTTFSTEYGGSCHCGCACLHVPT
jgi:hypothetical protein